MINNNEFNKIIGKRIKAIRSVYNEGVRLTVKQFAHLLGISKNQLLNFESGRTALPINILFELYNRGISIVFIVAGDGDVFANNNCGKSLKQKLLNNSIDYNTIIQKLLITNNDN